MKKSAALDGTLPQALCAAALMAPALRLVPRRAAFFAGSECWLSPLAAVPFILLDVWFLGGFLKNRRAGEGLGEMLTRALGPVFGTGAVLLFSAWMLFYCGFILRSGADRFISTVYPASRPLFFSAAMLLPCLPAALGRPETLARSAKVLLPAVAGVVLLVILLSMPTTELSELGPITPDCALPVLRGAVPVVNVVGAMLTYVCFLEGGAPKTPFRFRRWAVWALPLCLLLALLCAATAGNFGGALTADLDYPFFAMVRNVRILRTVERIEAMVVAIWVLPDFVLVSMLLIIASRSLMSVFGYAPVAGKPRLWDMRGGRFIIPLCALAAALISVYAAPDSFALERLSELLIPRLNMGLIFGFLPLCFAVGKLRGTI
jgi:spore germination protein KB